MKKSIFLIFLLFCKKETIIQEEELKKNIFTGIYELYPSYPEKRIQFKENDYCEIIIEKEFHDCIYKISNHYLLIFIKSGIPEGIFLIQDYNNKQKYLKGLWETEVRFLRKINTQEGKQN